MDGPFLLRPKLETKGCEFQGVYGCSTKKPNGLSVETLMPNATGYYYGCRALCRSQFFRKIF